MANGTIKGFYDKNGNRFNLDYNELINKPDISGKVDKVNSGDLTIWAENLQLTADSTLKLISNEDEVIIGNGDEDGGILITCDGTSYFKVNSPLEVGGSGVSIKAKSDLSLECGEKSSAKLNGKNIATEDYVTSVISGKQDSNIAIDQTLFTVDMGSATTKDVKDGVEYRIYAADESRIESVQIIIDGHEMTYREAGAIDSEGHPYIPYTAEETGSIEFNNGGSGVGVIVKQHTTTIEDAIASSQTKLSDDDGGYGQRIKAIEDALAAAIDFEAQRY